MGNLGQNTPTWAGGIVAGAILLLAGVCVLFRGNIHF